MLMSAIAVDAAVAEGGAGALPERSSVRSREGCPLAGTARESAPVADNRTAWRGGGGGWAGAPRPLGWQLGGCGVAGDGPENIGGRDLPPKAEGGRVVVAGESRELRFRRFPTFWVSDFVYEPDPMR